MNNRFASLQQLFSEGAKLLQTGHAELALVYFREALKIEPLNPTLLLYLGAVLHDLKRFDEAVACYKNALQSAPQSGEIHNNMGNSLMELGRFAEASQFFSKAIALLPSSPVPLTARATALQSLGNITEAEAECRKALLLDPSFAAAHWNLALNLLLQGNYNDGWREYEWRWLKPGFTSPSRHTGIPLWDGSPLNGQIILLHAEQGFGDAIQFVRYAQMVAKRGGDVVLECHQQLVTAFQGVEGVREVVPFGAPLPQFSCQAPLLSLPRIFDTTLQNIPAFCPYLSVSAELRRKWSALLPATPKALRVGLVWAGKGYPDPLRSCRLADFAPLAADNIIFFSLQLGAGAKETEAAPPAMQLIDLTANIIDFADTAAQIEQLDLIISIDTAVAHLSGALGKPIWLLLPFAPDWRWLLERSDSPWYPTMHVFRQKEPGNWSEVVGQVKAELNLIAAHN